MFRGTLCCGCLWRTSAGRRRKAAVKDMAARTSANIFNMRLHEVCADNLDTTKTARGEMGWVYTVVVGCADCCAWKLRCANNAVLVERVG